MSLLFSSGGGRLGNQILNLIHLKAIAFEYKIKVKKVNDLYIRSKKFGLTFNIKKNIVNWECENENLKKIILYKFFLKAYVIWIHFYYYFHPCKKSYIIGEENNYPKFLLGNYLGNKLTISQIIEKSIRNNIVLSGWGLRDWENVIKHKKLIIEQILKGFDKYSFKKYSLNEKNYLFVHIRRTDFLFVNKLKEINFSYEIWSKSIIAICKKFNLIKVALFCDEEVPNSFLEILENYGIEVTIPEEFQKNNFLNLYIKYISYASKVMCNASTLALSLSFLFHEKIYLPSNKNHFQEVDLKDAHNSFPTCLNWK